MNRSQNPGGRKKSRAKFCSCGTVCARESGAGLEWLFEMGHWKSRWKRSYFLMPCGGHKAFLQRMHRKCKSKQGSENCSRKFDMGWKFFLCLGPAWGGKRHLRSSGAQVCTAPCKGLSVGWIFPTAIKETPLGGDFKGGKREAIKTNM